MSALGINPDIDIRDLLELSVSDDWSVQFSPLLRGPGGAQGGTFIRRAAPWKGLTKGDNESFSEYVSRLENVNPGVASGLESARSMALQHAEGTEGLAIVRKAGQVYPIPTGAAEMMEAAGNGEVLQRGLQSAAEAIDEAVRRGARRPSLPSVY